MSKIKTQVMASIVVIHALRQLVSATALKAYGLLVAFIGTASFVSLGNVVQNFLGVGISGGGHFIVYALLHTASVVQFLSLAVFVFALLLARDIIRSAFRSSPVFV